MNLLPRVGTYCLLSVLEIVPVKEGFFLEQTICIREVSIWRGSTAQ